MSVRHEEVISKGKSNQPNYNTFLFVLDLEISIRFLQVINADRRNMYFLALSLLVKVLMSCL